MSVIRSARTKASRSIRRPRFAFAQIVDDVAKKKTDRAKWRDLSTPSDRPDR
jgi:hypothetical protein